MSTSSLSQTDFLTCQACQMQPAARPDIVCASCRQRMEAKDAGSLGLTKLARLVRTVFLETCYCTLVSFHVLPPLVMIQDARASVLDILSVAGLPILFSLPIIATLRAYVVRPYLRKIGQWGWLCAAHLASMALATVIVASWAKFQHIVPSRIMLVLHLLVIVCGFGIVIARMQEYFFSGMTAPIQRKLWRSWAYKGWGIGSLFLISIPLLMPDPFFGLFFGMACAMLAYHIYAHLVLWKYVRDQQLIGALQRDFNAIWYYG